MATYFKFIAMMSCVFLCSTASLATAADVSVGAGGLWQSSPYKGHDDHTF